MKVSIYINESNYLLARAELVRLEADAIKKVFNELNYKENE